jgi:DNA invertase Pin-like site-specific DNA recombinase
MGKKRLDKEGQKRLSKNAKPKVIAYLRVSTGTQDLDNQKLGLLELANKNHWKIEFVEEKISGTVPYKDRLLKQVVDGLKSGDILAVAELSRLGRSMLEIMSLLCELKEKGIKVYSVKGNYELNGNSLTSKVMTMVFCMASEIERDLISSRTKEALARKKKEGVKLGRPKGPGKSRLDGKEEEIKRLLDKKVGIASIAKIYDITWPAMDNFIKKKIKGIK